MVLLSCPGSLVIRQGNQSMCFLCGTPVNDIFSHLLAFCNRTQSFSWRRISMVNLISQLKANPGSAASIMIWGLFMSGDRSHIQREFVELFACLCSSVAGADLWQANVALKGVLVCLSVVWIAYAVTARNVSFVKIKQPNRNVKVTFDLALNDSSVVVRKRKTKLSPCTCSISAK